MPEDSPENKINNNNNNNNYNDNNHETVDKSDIGSSQVAVAGDIRVTDEVIAIIAGIAAIEVKGVTAMSGGIAGGIAEMLGRRNMTKGVRVEAGEKEAVIDLFIIVDYGCRIPDVAWQIQERVKESVESMTGMRVLEVNIHIQGVSLDRDARDKDNKDPKDPKDPKDLR